MRSASRVATLLVVPVLLTACGSTTPSAPTGEASGSGPASGSFPVSIEHTYGSSTISEQPERVAVVGLNEKDALLALGGVPVATTYWYGDAPGAIFPWAQEGRTTPDGGPALPGGYFAGLAGGAIVVLATGAAFFVFFGLRASRRCLSFDMVSPTFTVRRCGGRVLSP